MENEKVALVAKLNKELTLQTKDPAVMRALLATSFKGFKDELTVKQAILEAMLCGYTFQDIVQKKIYAIPFGSGYSLVQAISDVRAIAMESGQIGKSAPVFVDDEKGNILTCTITVQKKIGNQIGNFTATVYFNEYNKGRDNWKTKPRTMIAKVAEMHALRMAFPIKLDKAYIEDEFREEDSNIANKMSKLKDETDKMKMGNLITETPKESEEKQKSYNDIIEEIEKENDKDKLFLILDSITKAKFTKEQKDKIEKAISGKVDKIINQNDKK